MSDTTPTSFTLTDSGDFHILNHRGRHFWRVGAKYGYSAASEDVPVLTGTPFPLERLDNADDLLMKDWVYYTQGKNYQRDLPVGGLNKEVIARDGFRALLIKDPLGSVIFTTAQARDYVYQGGDATLVKVFI